MKSLSLFLGLPLLLVSYGLVLTPRLHEEDRQRVASTEDAAVATLRAMVAAQRRALEAGFVDEDGDGLADLVTIGELAGAVAVRGRSATLAEPPLPNSFRSVAPGAAVERAGYRFHIDGHGSARGERSLWGVYAWPVDPELRSARVFYADAEGAVWVRANEGGRSFFAAAPPPRAGPTAARQGDATALETAARVGRDGDVWTRRVD